MTKDNKSKPSKIRKLAIAKWIFTALAVLSSASIMPIGYSSAASSDNPETTGLYAFGSAIVIGLVICIVAWTLIVIDIAVDKKKPLGVAGNVLLLLLLPVVCIAAFGATGQVAYNSYQPVLDAKAQKTKEQDEIAKKKSIHQDKKLLKVLKSVGAKGDYSDLNLKWGAAAKMKTLCGWKDAGGCMMYNNQGEPLIYIRSDIDRNYLKTTMAHEYLHYVWDKHDLNTNRKLTAALINLYSKSAGLQRKLGQNSNNHYLDTGGLQPTEFFAAGCSEVSNATLGSYITKHCKKYIDTSTLTALY